MATIHLLGFTLVSRCDDIPNSVMVENVILGSIAESKGLHSGDEVMLINDKSPAELEWAEIEHLTNTGISLLFA